MRRRALAALLLIALAAACRAKEPDQEVATATPVVSPSPTPVPSPAAPVASPQAPAQIGPAPDLPKDRPLRAGFLVIEGVYNTELAAPYDVFHHTQFHTQPGMQVFTVSPDGKTVTTFEGLKLTPAYSFANAPAIDILVVPSARGNMDTDLQNQALINWVRNTGNQARHMLSLCDGAFLLAKAGLLQGIPATTFPDDYERFSQMFPDIDLRINASFVDAGKVITSQGGARSYEAAMHLVDRLYGQQVAQGIGKGLLIPWPPDPDDMTARIVEPAGLPKASPPATPAPQPTPGPG